MVEQLYEKIPEYPERYSVGTVLGRLVDGIGFRYRWAAEGLRDEDLEYKPSESSRTIAETLLHVDNLVVMTECALRGERYDLPEPTEARALDELRQTTLEGLQRLSEELKVMPDERFEEMQVRFKMRGNDIDFPFWNAINGTLSDALYHVGQVVAFRRAAGNPINSAVNVFVGAVRD